MLLWSDNLMDRGGENPKEATGEGNEYAPEQGLLLTDLRVARGEPSLEYVWGETSPNWTFLENSRQSALPLLTNPGWRTGGGTAYKTDMLDWINSQTTSETWHRAVLKIKDWSYLTLEEPSLCCSRLKTLPLIIPCQLTTHPFLCLAPIF